MPSDYRAAIESTEMVINQRVRIHRIHVLTTGVTVTAIALAAAFIGPRLLALLVFVVPMSGAFLIADAARVRRWRFELLALWSQRVIDCMAFRQAITAHPHLPFGTVGAMLARLPVAKDVAAEQAIDVATRNTIVADVVARDRREGRKLLATVLGAAVLATLAVIAVLIRD